MSAIYRNGKWYGKDNGHIIMNNAGLELKPRATLQFGGDLSTTDDNTNERTVIKPHEISSEEWEDIVNLLPGGVPNNGIVIDTRGNEYIVGKYIESDGTIKPLYQKSVLCSIASDDDNNTLHNINNLESVIEIKAYSKVYNSNTWRAIPSAYYGIANNKAGWNVDIYITDSKIVIQPGSDFAEWHQGSCYVTIQYTKTTD